MTTELAWSGRLPTFPAALPEKIDELLSLLARGGLSDAVLIGGLPRDLILGRPYRDIDFTFAVNLLAEEEAFLDNPYLWNSVLAAALRPRLQMLYEVLGAAQEAGNFQARYASVSIDYVGPYEAHIDGEYHRSRWSAVFSTRNGLLLTRDAGVSINSLGLTTDRRLIGDRSGLDDLKEHRIRTLRAVTDVGLDTALRYVLLAEDLGFSLSVEIEDAIGRLVHRSRYDPRSFGRDAAKVSTVVENLLANVRHRMDGSQILAGWERRGLAEALVELPESGSHFRHLLYSEQNEMLATAAPASGTARFVRPNPSLNTRPSTACRSGRVSSNVSQGI